MKKESTGAKICLLVIFIAAIMWLGGIHTRAIVSFELFENGTLEFRSYIHPSSERTIFRINSSLSLLTTVTYIVLWITGLIFLRLTSLKFSKDGWLLMSFILFYMFTPVEIYTLILDINIWYMDYIGSDDLVKFRELFIRRLRALSGIPYIAMMCYYTIIVLIIFKPFHRDNVISV